MANGRFAFRKINYLIMIGGILLLIIGLLVMASDGEPYGFGTLGLTVGPLIVFLGFIAQFVAILYKSKKESTHK